MIWRAAFLMFLLATPAAAQITGARYLDATTRYGHDILGTGNGAEWGALELTLEDGRKLKMTLPQSRVFEDLFPRLIDLDFDGDFEVVVIETSVELGGSMAIYDETGKIAATPFLGLPQRWLAPIGAADLDGDGVMEIAFIEKPHLAKILRVWRFENNKLTFVGSLDNLTNHAIGENFISGGIRDCGQGPEIITADGRWNRVMASVLKGGRLSKRDLGAYEGRDSLRDALACDF
jgi:VCBS repeat protein